MKNLCKKYGKRVKAFLLTMVMALSLVQMVAEPEAVKAEVTEAKAVNMPQNLYVDNKAIVENGVVNQANIEYFGGKVSYNEETGVLTLDGSKASNKKLTIYSRTDGCMIKSDGDLIINVASEIIVTAGDYNTNVSHILYAEGNISITGEKLNLVHKNFFYQPFNGVYSKSGDINIQNNLDIAIQGQKTCAIYAVDGNVNVTNANLVINMTGVSSNSYGGIICYNGDVNITNSTANLNVKNGCAIRVFKTDESEKEYKVNIVNETSSDPETSNDDPVKIDAPYGIYSAGAVVIKSDMFVNNTSESSDRDAFGINCATKLEINGADVTFNIAKKQNNGTYRAIKAHTMEVKDAELWISAPNGVDVQSGGDLTFLNSEVHVHGSSGSAICLYAGANMTVKGGNLEISSNYSKTIRFISENGNEKITVTDGTVYVVGGSNNNAVVWDDFNGNPNSEFGSIDLSQYGDVIVKAATDNNEANLVVKDATDPNWYEGFRSILITGPQKIEGIENVTVEDILKEYDGEEVSITVNGIPEGATIKYGTVEGQYDLDESPKFKEVSNNTVYFIISKEGFASYKGSAKVTITSYPFGGDIEDLNDITIDKNEINFGIPSVEDRGDYIYLPLVTPVRFLGIEDVDAYLEKLKVGTANKVIPVPFEIDINDVTGNAQILETDGTIFITNAIPDGDEDTTYKVDEKSLVVVYKFHKDNFIMKEYTNEEGDKNPYGESFSETYIYAVYGVEAAVVTPTPVITKQPENASVIDGGKATFTVEVEIVYPEISVFTYQWQVDKGDGFVDIEGATEATYTTEALTKENSGYKYQCIVTNIDNKTATTEVAKVTVTDKAPVITEPSENEDATVEVGGKVTFEVEAEGDNLKYQWQVKVDGVFKDIEGATGSTYTANKFDKCGDVYKYRCIVSNDGGEAESAVFTVTVKHTLKEVKANGATCTATGNNPYFKCEVEGCGACFKDAEGTKTTTVEAETIKMLDHDWATEWSKDGANHWHKCNDCTATNDVTPHADTDKDNVCDACKTVLHTHKLVEVPGVPATCDKPGNNKYYKCEVEGCGAFFKDAEGKTPTTEAAEVIAATGHADLNKDEVCDSCKTDLHEHVLTKVPAADATCTAAGNKEHYKCNCGKLFADAEGKTATTLEAVTIAPTAHADKDGDMVCDECKTELHKHVLVKVPGVAATCTTPGTKEYYKCTVENCTELFADAEGKTATTLEATKIAALGHDWSGEWDVTKEATATEEGKKETLCERDCGQKKVVNIPKTGETDENGNVDKDAEVEAEAPIKEATLDNSKSELIGAGNIFTKEDKEAIERGEDARVWIEITKTDETTIKDKDKAKMEEEAAELVGENATLTYFDVDLFKQVGNGKVYDIPKPGVAIKITIAIPEGLLNHDKTLEREYKIIRLHTEGDVSEVDVISGEFNAETGEFSFETDRFSTYAITYADSPVVPDTPEVPDTGDTTSAMPIIMLFVGLGMVVAGLRRKVN